MICFCVRIIFYETRSSFYLVVLLLLMGEINCVVYEFSKLVSITRSLMSLVVTHIIKVSKHRCGDFKIFGSS